MEKFTNIDRKLFAGRLFKTEDLVRVTGLTRSLIEQYRIKEVLRPIEMKPLRWDYSGFLLAFLIAECRKVMKLTKVNDVFKLISNDLRLSFLDEDFLIVSERGLQLIAISYTPYTSEDYEKLESEFVKQNKPVIHVEDSGFFDIDDPTGKRRAQIILENYFVISINRCKQELAKKGSLKVENFSQKLDVSLAR